MQKKLFYYLFYRKRYVKFFRIMRLCFLFVFLGMLSATAKTIAQEQVISLNFTAKPVFVFFILPIS